MTPSRSVSYKLPQENYDEFKMRLPGPEVKLDQDSEYCEINIGDAWQRIRFHDYHELYSIPGFYEALFYRALKCCSPARVVGMLDDVLADYNEDPTKLVTLDIGAGNGMVGELVQGLGSEKVVGLDIIEEAKDAALRDRSYVYNDYLVADLTNLTEAEEERLRSYKFNCLTTVAALGYGDIPSKGFLKGLDLLESEAWMAFNIKERFLYETRETGFARLIDQLRSDKILRIEAFRRYRHRFSTAGEPLHYVAVVARKLRDLPDHYLQG